MWKDYAKAFPKPNCVECLRALHEYGQWPIRCFHCGANRQITNWVGAAAETRLLPEKPESLPFRPPRPQPAETAQKTLFDL
ncbi:MAG: hypothetical protein K1Y36_05175 [Blastocatellia bacterium]|nr:hypothetical protein [Blastocatellia bacterium]